MEDAHVHILEAPQDSKAAYFAVFDGHGVNLLILIQFL